MSLVPPRTHYHAEARIAELEAELEHVRDAHVSIRKELEAELKAAKYACTNQLRLKIEVGIELERLRAALAEKDAFLDWLEQQELELPEDGHFRWLKARRAGGHE